MPDDDIPSYDEFAHRQAHAKKDIPALRKPIYDIVEKLLDLEARTHPQNSAPGDKEKDSILALRWVERLVEHLAGWALDHRAGMILNGAQVFPWPEDDQEAPPQANNHRHEAVGSAYLKDRGPGDPILNRRIMAEVTTRASLMPAALRRDLSKGLKALNLGEVQPLLSPAKNQTRLAYTIWSYRLRAIEHVYFFWGMGEIKEEAFNKVGLAYGAEGRTVNSWDRAPVALRKHFGERVVKVRRDSSKRSGEKVRRLQLTIPQSDLDKELIDFLLQTYGPRGLAQNAQEHKKALRESSP